MTGGVKKKKKASCAETLTPADDVTQPGPVRREAAAQTANQQHQLGAVDAVPHERCQQEEVQQRRHRCAGAGVRLHVPTVFRDDVGVKVHLRRALVAAGVVVGPAEEEEDEGQQGGVDVQQHQLGVEVALPVPAGFADAGGPGSKNVRKKFVGAC